VLGFFVNTSLVIIEVHNVLVQKGRLAPLVIIGGALFWFIIDATVLALGDVPFTSRYPLYPYFAAGLPVDVVGKTLFRLYLFQVCGLLGLRYIRVPNRFLDLVALRKDAVSGSALDFACLLVASLSYVPFIVQTGDLSLVLGRLIEMRNAEGAIEFAATEPG